MSFVNFSRSIWHVYDFSGPQIQIFNRKKRLYFCLTLFFYIYWFFLSSFHFITDNSVYRYLLADFIVAQNYGQSLFDGSIVCTHLAMIRMCVYLLAADARKDYAKFQWLQFLRIEDERTLVKKHFFKRKQAASYLRLVGACIRFVKINELIYILSCFAVMGRVLFLASTNIPLHWFVLSTVPNAVGYLFMTISAFSVYNYFITIYFANAMFIKKSLQSLSSQSLRLNKLKKSQTRQLCRQNLLQFNYIINNFRQSQRNLNYTFSYR